MKTIIKTLIAASAVSIAAVGTASAHDQIDRTQAYQVWEIEQARRSGQLTRREYRELQAEQARIAELERQAKSDGYLSRREYRQIRQAQRDAQNHIYTESHDRQVSLWRRWKYRYGFHNF
jgi:hypothetical protein